MRAWSMDSVVLSSTWYCDDDNDVPDRSAACSTTGYRALTPAAADCAAAAGVGLVTEVAATTAAVAPAVRTKAGRSLRRCMDLSFGGRRRRGRGGAARGTGSTSWEVHRAPGGRARGPRCRCAGATVHVPR